MDYIVPIFQDEFIPIVFQSSQQFVPYLFVAIESIVMHCDKKCYYDIIVLTDFEPKKENDLMQNASYGNNISIRFFNASDWVESYVETSRYKYLKLNYFRIALPWILQRYKRVINLGGDVIVNQDIRILFQKEIREVNYIGGVIDLAYIGKVRAGELEPDEDIGDYNKYINADVMLFELEKIRNSFQLDDIMMIWQRKRRVHAEQDVFNIFFENKIEFFDNSWNVFPPDTKAEIDIMRSGQENIKKWKDALQYPIIIHFAWEPKPWNNSNIGFGTLWWSIAKNTPYYFEIEKNKGNIQFKNFWGNLKEILLPYGSKRRRAIRRLIRYGNK